MRILLDCDGVIADFVSHACETIFEEDGAFFRPEDFKHWDLSRTLDIDQRAVLEEATCSKHWCYRIPVYEGAQNFVERLKDLGDVRALTAAVGNSKHWINERKWWLADHMSIPEKHVVFCPTDEKRFHFGDVLIEDRLETCIAWADRWTNIEARPRTTAILIDRPWNSGPTPFGVYRVHSYNEALELIEGMS